MRTAFFLDIDNLCGTGTPGPELVRTTIESFESEYTQEAGDLIFCAGTRTSALNTKLLRPGYHTRCGRGVDGADRQLLELMDIEWLTSRFDRVVLGSGDHIFGSKIESLRSSGLDVEVFCGAGALSGLLLKALGPRSRRAVRYLPGNVNDGLDAA